MNKNANLHGYKVKEIRYPYGIYKLAQPTVIIDEGSFYRIDGTHIIDIFRIKKITPKDNTIILEMKDHTDILLTVVIK